MILVGTMNLTLTRSTGTFYCPSCAATRVYKHKVERQFLTVYFIPLIPLQVVEQHLQCTQCRNKFNVTESGDVEVAPLQRQVTYEWIRRVLVMIVAADDVVTDEELEAVRRYAREYLDQEPTSEQILSEAARAYEHQFSALTFARHIAPQLTEADKELLVRHAFLAATASGDLSRYRQELLAELPQAIGIPETRFREIVTQASHWPEDD